MRSDTKVPVDQGSVQLVLHVGQYGQVAGGMAQVVNEYLSWDVPGLAIRAVRTTRGKGDRLSPLYTAAAAFRLLRYRLANKRASVVVHLSERGSFLREGAIVIYSRLLGFRTVAHLHGAHFVQFAKAHPRVVRAVLRSASSVGSLTKETSEAARQLCPKVDVRTVPNIVSLIPRTAPSPRVQQVLFGGEIGIRKGVDVLMAAWPRVRELHPGWELILAGPISDELKGRVTADGVHLRGALARTALFEELEKSAIAVLPSRDEALPMFLIEAMANGCALVATDVGEVKRLCDAENGRIVNLDPESLSAALAELIALGTEELERLGEASYQRYLKEYSPQAGAASIVSLWLGEGVVT